MSHPKERTEKICLNCKNTLQGRFCHICGQENIEPRQSVWHLAGHFFNDITHFDGNFFTTLKDLLTRPGFLSREYMAGRRQSYLNPVRMYIFTSAIFFIFFFTVFNPKKIDTGDIHVTVASLEQRERELLRDAKSPADSIAILKAFSYTDRREKDSVSNKPATAIESRNHERQYQSMKEYDSIQHALPTAFRDGYFRRIFFQQAIELNKKYKNDSHGFITEWLNALFHNFPKLLFISLPLFALLLKLVYIRRKAFFYVDHGIFAIHIYVYSFIVLLIYFGIVYLERITRFRWLWIPNLALGLFSLAYFYRSLKNFYGQSAIKTLIKFILIGILSIVMIFFLFSVFFVYSFVEI